MRVILLGPQRRPTVDAALRSLPLGPGGRIAMVTAGWQERESDDAELNRALGGRAVNLGLYRRWLDAQDRDPEYEAAERRMQEVLAELQDIYCRTPGPGCCSTTPPGWPSSPGGSRRPGVSSWTREPGWIATAQARPSGCSAKTAT